MERHTIYKTYGLIGKTLSHSLSCDYFTAYFQEHGITAEYVNFELTTIEELRQLLATKKQLCGFNVTIPYKQEIIPLLDNVSDVAKEVNAVNVVKIEKCNSNLLLNGFNTDVTGFEYSLTPLLRDTDKQAIIIGTGGAAMSAAYVLKKLGIDYQFFSRSKPQSDNIISYNNPQLIDYRNTDIIINATPLGMFPDIDSCPPVDFQQINAHHICYDMVYNPQETKFLKYAKQQGATIINGLKMLYRQAEDSWAIWNET